MVFQHVLLTDMDDIGGLFNRPMNFIYIRFKTILEVVRNIDNKTNHTLKLVTRCAVNWCQIRESK